jgi:4-hydroxyphenylpyruvate dioxygenase-like putative hemolysin
MGFQVLPGGSFPDGVANRIIRFPDSSYLELLYFTKPEQDLAGEALEEFGFTKRSGGGANSFALAVEDPEHTREHLSRRGFALKDADPLTYDPDGEGPRPPAILWRTVQFPKALLASTNLFFISYSPSDQTEDQARDREAFSRHPNGALGISAVWLLSANIEQDSEVLERLGLREGERLHLPHIKARGVRFDTAREALILVEPSGPGPAADAVAARGPHIYAVSVAVADLNRAERIIKRGYGRAVARYLGPLGEAISTPSTESGLVVEFHQAPICPPR